MYIRIDIVEPLRSNMARPKYKEMYDHAVSIIAELNKEVIRQRRLIDDLLSGDLEPEEDE